VDSDDTASNSLLTKGFALLDTVPLEDFYGPPCAMDDAIAMLLIALADGPDGDWETFHRSLTEQRRRVLGRFALRAPMVALRARNARHLYSGLLAHCLIRRTVTDWRDDLVFFAPYVHVARTLCQDVSALFDKAALYAAPDLATIMQKFCRRQDITLGAFGWRQIDTADGPTFESVGWKNGPTGAVVGERTWNQVNEGLAQELLEWVRKQSPRPDS